MWYRLTEGRVLYAIEDEGAYNDVCVPFGGIGMFVCLC
jgi:hypothetical protein